MENSNARVIFGMKLRQLRTARALSLQQLADRSGLSISYLNEIEKGRKYPKVEKVELIARALAIPFDELVSQKLGEEQGHLETFLQSPALRKFPLHLFGLTIQDLVSLVPNTQKEGKALLNALVDVTRSYDLRIEDFFHTALRCYQEMHRNHFEEVEQAVEDFRRKRGWKANETVGKQALYEALIRDFRYEIDETTIAESEHLRGLRSVWLEGPRPRLLINGEFTEIQKAFIAARELGFRVLKISPRGRCSPDIEVESFEQVLGAYKASYFASALFMSRSRMKKDLQAFFRSAEWSDAALLQMLGEYRVTPEMFFYRMSEIFPQVFGISRLHFLRFENTENSDFYGLSKHLNMSQVNIPAGLGLGEHFCRRWLSIKIIRQFSAAKLPPGALLAGAQRSIFLDGQQEYLCLSVARRMVLSPGRLSSITIGFAVDADLRRVIRFSKDPRIPQIRIGETCERCPLTKSECRERAVAAATYHREKQRTLQIAEIQRLERR